MVTVTAQVTPSVNTDLKKLMEYHKLTRPNLISVAIDHFLEKAGSEQTKILDEWKIKSKKGQLLGEKQRLELRIREIDKEIGEK